MFFNRLITKHLIRFSLREGTRMLTPRNDTAYAMERQLLRDGTRRFTRRTDNPYVTERGYLRYRTTILTLWNEVDFHAAFPAFYAMERLSCRFEPLFPNFRGDVAEQIERGPCSGHALGGAI